MTSTIDKKLHGALPSTEDCDPKSQRGGRWTRRINRLRSTLRGMYLVPDLDDDDDPDFDETFDPDAQTLTPRQCVVVARVATELADAVFADAHLLGNRPRSTRFRVCGVGGPSGMHLDSGCDMATHHGSLIR